MSQLLLTFPANDLNIYLYCANDGVETEKNSYCQNRVPKKRYSGIYCKGCTRVPYLIYAIIPYTQQGVVIVSVAVNKDGNGVTQNANRNMRRLNIFLQLLIFFVENLAILDSYQSSYQLLYRGKGFSHSMYVLSYL